MPIEPVKIPQNVQVEDRLIGFVTMRQVFLCLAGGGISYVLWNLLKSSGFATTGTAILAWSPLVIAAAFAFIKYQNLTLLRMILLFLEKSDKPPVRSFGPRTGISVNVEKYYDTESDDKQSKTYRRSLERDKLHNLSSLLDEKDATQNEERNEENDNLPDNATDGSASAMPVDPQRITVDQPRKGSPSVDGVSARDNSGTGSAAVTVPPGQSAPSAS